MSERLNMVEQKESEEEGDKWFDFKFSFQN